MEKRPQELAFARAAPGSPRRTCKFFPSPLRLDEFGDADALRRTQTRPKRPKREVCGGQAGPFPGGSGEGANNLHARRKCGSQ